MRANYYSAICLFVILLITALGVPQAAAQTPGLIYKTATAGGAKILDPNQDGYVSTTRAGFSNGKDEGTANSEIPYRQFPALTTEPIGDLNTGTAGGHTDLATPTTPITSPSTGSPISAYFDGTNLLFRVRLGGSSTASKGYSVLIDSDNTFTGTGTNPGFEFEVLLASNTAVQVIKHTSTGSSTIFTGSVDQYSQRAVAGSTNGGNADYFYDFYVPLTAFQGGITAASPLRMSGITITSAQSGFTGTVSDVGGVNFQNYNYDAPTAWRALIGSFPATSLTNIQTTGFPPIAATAPIVSGPIAAFSTTISGTSVEAAGSVVTVYKNGVTICGSAGQPTCPTVSSSGTWTLSALSSTSLTAGDKITATVTAPNKTVSALSNLVTVIAGACTSTPAPVLTNLGGSGNMNKTFIGTTAYNANQRISIYSTQSATPIGTFLFNPTTAGTSTFTSPVYVLGEIYNYYATTTPLDASGNVIGCESAKSNQLCFRNGQPSINTQVVQITSVTYNNVSQSNATSSTWNEIPTNISSISGTLSLGTTNTAGNIVVFKNGNPTTLTVPFTTTTTTWTINPTAAFIADLKPGDVLNVRTDLTLTGGGQSTCPNTYSSRSGFLTVQETTAAPTINPVACGRITRITGTSTEPAGTVIQFYTGGTVGQRNGTLITQSGTSTAITAAVSATGNWSADLSSAAGGGVAAGTPVTARAKVTGKVRSVNSAAVTSAPAPTGTLTINAPITEGQTSLSGTAPAGSQVTVYIEGTPFSPVTTNASGTWTASGFSPQELFAGAAVTANFKIAGNDCESEKITPVIVQCSPPSSSPTVSPATLNICSGSTAQVTLSNSEAGVAYRLITLTGTTETDAGNSVLGTGGTIILTSYQITNTTTLRVRARKISGTACTTVLPGSTLITANPLPATTNSITISSASGCAGTTVTVTVAGTQTGFSYQLINNATKTPVVLTSGDSNAKPGTGGAVQFVVASVATTTYGLRITNTTTGCSVEGANTVTYTVTGPLANQDVSLSTTRICLGGSALVYVQTNNDGASYQLFRTSDNLQVPGTASLTGNGLRQSFTVSPTVNTTYYVKATGGGCTVNLTKRVTLEVGAAFAAVTAGSSQTICGSTVSLQGSNPAPGTGLWTIKSKPQGSSDPVFTAASSAATSVSGLVSGSYTFTWTVTSNCSGTTGSSSSADVTIVVNCPAIYNIAPPKYRNEYKVNDILATASDPDGTINQANVVAGTGSLPTGTNLLANGNIVVTNTAEGLLVPGNYSFSVRTVDANGGETVTPIVIRIYGTAPIIIPLPVELVYFSATVRNNHAHLEWLTASEQNNDRFEIERSSDAKSFEMIGTVKGMGTSSLKNKYEFTDKTPVQGTVYYRLKQVDFDGEFAYSKVIAVSAKGLASELATQVYPNPFQDIIKVTLTAPQTQQAELFLYDINGKQVLRKALELQAGANLMELSLKQLNAGMYILKIVGSGMETTTKIIKN